MDIAGDPAPAPQRRGVRAAARNAEYGSVTKPAFPWKWSVEYSADPNGLPPYDEESDGFLSNLDELR